MKSPASLKRIFGKDIKPGDIIYWFSEQIDIILSVELLEDEVYGRLLTQKLETDWFGLDPEGQYEIIDVATRVWT